MSAVEHRTWQYTVQCNTTQCNLQCSAIYSPVQYNTVQYTIQCSPVFRGTEEFSHMVRILSKIPSPVLQYAVYSIHYILYIVHYIVQPLQYIVCIIHFGMYSTQQVCSIQYTVYIHFIINSIQYTIYSIQYTIYSVQHTLYIIQSKASHNYIWFT